MKNKNRYTDETSLVLARLESRIAKMHLDRIDIRLAKARKKLMKKMGKIMCRSCATG
jgi:hypothetical protein